jgi:hypothetical protein
VKVTRVLLTVVVALTLQMALARYAVAGRWVFDLVVVGVIYAALYWGSTAGMWTGTLGGLTQDALSGDVVGLGGFAKTIVGYGAGVLGAQFIVARPVASRCRVVRNRGTEREAVLDPKQRLLVLAAGETIRMETPGGAGLGDPGERDPLALARDLADGRVTAPADRRGYGEALPSAASPAGAALGDAPGGEDE